MSESELNLSLTNYASVNELNLQIKLNKNVTREIKVTLDMNQEVFIHSSRIPI